ncbi:MAG: DUF2071 domain-containing protein [Salibacteraceae bacterium]
MLPPLPFSYRGTLNQVKLVAFSVDRDEIVPRLPDPLRMLPWRNRAIITLVNVKLTEMRPAGFPRKLGINYQHLAFRLSVDDSHLFGGKSKGIFFLDSFTNQPWIKMSGNMASSYRFNLARIKDDDYLCELRAEDRFFHYAYSDAQPQRPDKALFRMVKRLDRAYAENLGRVYCTQIMRKEWPIQWKKLYHLETNFFETARPEGMFTVQKPIAYLWKAPVKIAPNLWERVSNAWQPKTPFLKPT